MNLGKLFPFSIFGKDNKKNILPMHSQDLAGDFVVVDMHAEDEFDLLDDLESQLKPQAPIAEEAHTLFEEETTIAPVVRKSQKQINWENQYRKVYATVLDKDGHLIEVRRVNKNKQLAFWSSEKDKQVYVYPTKNTEELATHDRLVFTLNR